MYQETGETRNAIMEDDNRLLGKIVEANKHRVDPYWVVVFAKPSKHTHEGRPVLIKHIKAYSIKPSSQVGMCVGEVNNSNGTITWEINMPQRPFDFDALIGMGAKEGKSEVVETTTIPWAYRTR